MTTSFPSRPITSIDIPDVKNFNTEFQYNFFSPDERTNDTDELSPRLQEELKQSTEAVDASIIEKITSNFPRFVKLTFTKSIARQNLRNEFAPQNRQINGSSTSLVGSKDQELIKSNFDKILDETSVFRNHFLGLNFQDNGIDNKLFFLVSGSIERKIAEQNRIVKQELQNEQLNLFDSLSRTNSLTEKSLSFADLGLAEVNNQLIINSLSNIENLGARYINDEQQKERIKTTFDDVRNVNLRGQINKKIFGKFIKNIANDPMSIFSDEFSSITQPADNIEQLAISRISPNHISANDYEISIDSDKVINSFSAIKKGNDITHFIPSIEVVGYIIEKYEISENGTITQKEPIILEGQDRTIAIDSKIKYGKRYAYFVKSVALIEIQSCIQETDDITSIQFLVSSKKSFVSLVHCIENIPPPPPADFNIIWDYKEDAPRVCWSFPVNPQRDIKKFQVFRRKTINEPFEMIKEYDFDDSEIKTRNTETPDQNFVVKTNNPILHFIDKEFNRRNFNKFIYSSCSVDAHGLKSNYSIQFEVSFDNFRNKIEKKLISNSGAPMSYPNFFLRDRDTFVDTIKTSGAGRMKIYFNPDFLEIDKGEDNEIIKLIGTNKNGGKYKMNFINLDLQKQENLDITITDLKTGNN